MKIIITIKQAVVVEGKYDKIKLESILDALIIPTDGFRIFKDRAMLELLRTLAKTRGLIILTDSDSAGFQIRAYLGGAVSEGEVTHVYVPDVFGKEPRKEKASSEGKLGVEGLPKEVLIKAFQQANISFEQLERPGTAITRQDFYQDGLIGRKNSAQKRVAFLKLLDLPERLSTHALANIINSILSVDAYRKIIKTIDERESGDEENAN